MKQSKLRRRRVVRYAILYFVLFVVFIALIVGPAVAGKYVPESLTDSLSNIAGMRLVQPNGQNKDNTNSTSQTGTGMNGYSGAGIKSTSTGRNGATSTGRIRLF